MPYIANPCGPKPGIHIGTVNHGKLGYQLIEADTCPRPNIDYRQRPRLAGRMLEPVGQHTNQATYVHEVPRLLAVTVHLERLTGSQTIVEDTNDPRVRRRRILPWTVDVEEPETGTA